MKFPVNICELPTVCQVPVDVDVTCTIRCVYYVQKYGKHEHRTARSRTAVTLFQQIRWLSQGPLVQEAACCLMSAQKKQHLKYSTLHVRFGRRARARSCSATASLHQWQDGWNVKIVCVFFHLWLINMESDLSLQTHRRISVRAPPPAVRSRLHGDPRSPARGRSVTRTAGYPQSATTNLQGRGSSKANTWVTTMSRR